jgi:glutamate 5-kinase
VEGQFEAQDVVAITDEEGREFARGFVNCASAEARGLIEDGGGTQDRESARVLVTRDHLVLWEKR